MLVVLCLMTLPLRRGKRHGSPILPPPTPSYGRPQRITQHPPIIATPSDQCILGAAHTLTTVRLTQRLQTSYVYGAMLNNGYSTLWLRTRKLYMPPPAPFYGRPHASPPP